MGHVPLTKVAVLGGEGTCLSSKAGIQREALSANSTREPLSFQSLEPSFSTQRILKFRGNTAHPGVVSFSDQHLRRPFTRSLARPLAVAATIQPLPSTSR